ncbi:hypothetical protein F5890DRAFT_1480300 [Lentinula detonsa]|uniref:Protein kinase domain-containing protein n=1 Tax=Lentinula detonsa TaxID=2804962 RepID=A0AA38QA49_9AGAR|nr:hypothetical protein F5890DRAFT_1480300 [Lentinula detonsa]
MQTTATISSMDTCILDPLSNFFNQLQTLLLPEPEPSSQSPVSAPIYPKSTVLDLQHVIDASRSQATLQAEPERSPSPERISSPSSIAPSDLFRQLYAPSGKWEWMKGHDILDESSTFLSAGAMCSTYYRKGRANSQIIDYICKSWHTSKHWGNGFYSELALYKRQLGPLQGKYVPHVIGVFSGPAVLNVAMEPPHSSFWIEASTDMPLSLKQRCVDAIAEIHSCGVFHGDIELRHMLIGGDARVTIIDFQESAALEPNERVFLQPATEADLRREMRKVKMKLDFPGARQYEKEKRERCLKREQHNKDEARKTILTPDYIPRLEDVPEDDQFNPPILDMQEWDDWVAAPSLPRLFVVPGQSLQQRQSAYDTFLASLESFSTSIDPSSNPFASKPRGGSSSPAQTGLRNSDMDNHAESSAFFLVQSRPIAKSTSMILDPTRQPKAFNLADTFPRLDPFPSKPSHDLSTTTVFDRLSLLRSLAESPSQAPGDNIPFVARDLLNAEMARVSRSSSTRKRTASIDSQDSERPIKRTRFDDEASGSSALSVVGFPSSSSSTATPSPSESNTENSDISLPLYIPPSESKPVGLGAYDWLPNLRYPSVPVVHDGRWSRIAMESLGHCALEELPHPDLIKLFPHHPRWAEPDVQVFLGRLQKKERELAWAAMRNPDRRVMGPRHHRSLGTLKRTLNEIQHNLEHLSSDTLIREQEPIRYQLEEDDSSERAVSGPDMANAKRPNTLASPYDVPLGDDGPLPRKVRFHNEVTSFPPPLNPLASSDIIKRPHETETESQYSQTWYQKSFGLLTQVLAGYTRKM